MNNIRFLIKAVKKEYSKSFYEEGQIFFNSLSFYQKEERNNDDKNIGDEMENPILYIPDAIIYIRPDDGLLNKHNAFDRAQYPFHSTASNVIGSKESHLLIYCLMLIDNATFENGQCYIYKKDIFEFISKFNDYKFFIINHPNDFLSKIQEELLRKGYGYQGFKMDRVTYLDKSNEFINMKGNPFFKRKRYEYQHEYRIVIKPSENISNLLLNIGNIKNMAFPCTFKYP